MPVPDTMPDAPLLAEDLRKCWSTRPPYGDLTAGRKAGRDSDTLFLSPVPSPVWPPDLLPPLRPAGSSSSPILTFPTARPQSGLIRWRAHSPRQPARDFRAKIRHLFLRISKYSVHPRKPIWVLWAQRVERFMGFMGYLSAIWWLCYVPCDSLVLYVPF